MTATLAERIHGLLAMHGITRTMVEHRVAHLRGTGRHLVVDFHALTFQPRVVLALLELLAEHPVPAAHPPAPPEGDPP
jgi:hypothetical protein